MKRKSNKRTCYEVQHSMKEYLTEKMSLQDAAAFVKHVRSCPACREELEEYYAFFSALMQLDGLDEWEEKGNFFLNIEKRLEQTEQTALKNKKNHRIRCIVYLVTALLVAAALGVRIGV